MELVLDVLKWSVIVGTAALALTLLKPLLDRRYSAKWRYGVWLVMAVFLLLSPVQWESLVPDAPVEPPVVIEVPKMEVSVSRQEGVSIQRPAIAPAARPAGAAVRQPRVFPLEKALTGLWLAGMGLFFLYHLFGTWYFTRKARRWSQQAGEDTAQVYEAVWREMGLKKAPRLRVSTAVDSPMAVGLFRPCLLLPGEDFSAQELTFVLRHELTHCRRRDLWYKLVLLAANGMHWFNPLVWLLRREAERDLELTCDDAVVKGRDDMERRAYSEALLASIHRQKGLGRAVLSTHFYGGKEVMMERFRNILGKRGRKWGGLALALALLATVAAACTFGVKPSDDGALSAEELAAWQEKLERPEMDNYIWKMYTDTAYLLSMEKLDEIFPVPEGMENLGHEDINPRVISGTRSGDTVTLEIEGNFASRLPAGTLTLVNDEPVSFTTPLYTAVETAARGQMESAAEAYISYAAENEAITGTLEFTEKYITNLFCSESMDFDGKAYYIWNLYYGMKPNDIGNVMFAGGMSEENGWVTQSSSPGDPILIFSMDADGSIVLEEQAWTGSIGEEGYTWEEYVCCHLYLGMDEMYGVLNGWPEINTSFLESLMNGHETWTQDWEDTALSYLSHFYDVYPADGLTVLRTFQADPDGNDHSQAVLAQAECGGSTATLLLANVQYQIVGSSGVTPLWFWQVVGVDWDPEAPAAAVPPEDVFQPGELTADELAALTSYFNVVQHNGLLRFPYTSLGGAREYMDILFYDMGEAVTDEAEREAAAELFGGTLETDCMKLARTFIQEYVSSNFTYSDADIFAGDVGLVMNSIDLPYLEEYDAYYMLHGDTMMSEYTFDRGERDADGVVSLYYTTDLWRYNDGGELDLLWDQPMCARMVPELQPNRLYTWRMLSNEAAG